MVGDHHILLGVDDDDEAHHVRIEGRSDINNWQLFPRLNHPLSLIDACTIVSNILEFEHLINLIFVGPGSIFKVEDISPC